MSIQVAIVDDHPLIMQGMQMLLSRYPHIILVGAFGSATELMHGLERMTPDVLLLDIQLPDKSGDELAPQILKTCPGIKILMLTNFNSPLYVHNALRNGVHGYLLKTTEQETLIHAIETVHNGGQFIEAALQEKMEEEIPKKNKRIFTTKSNLTSRETEILQLIVNGYTDPEIAQQLFLSLHTVKRYRINILLKLDVKNTAALVNKALKLGLAV
jgi:DNA-binding NarL/FixJ family response regulator